MKHLDHFKDDAPGFRKAGATALGKPGMAATNPAIAALPFYGCQIGFQDETGELVTRCSRSA